MAKGKAFVTDMRENNQRYLRVQSRESSRPSLVSRLNLIERSRRWVIEEGEREGDKQRARKETGKGRQKE